MKVIIPTDLSEITLSQYKRYKKVVLDNIDDQTYCCIQMVSIFCNLNIADVMKIPSLEFAEIVEHLSKVLDQDSELVRTFKINGVNYGFIPNLEQITLAEHADIDTCFGDDERLELMLSIAYRPITKKARDFYDIEPYEIIEAKSHEGILAYTKDLDKKIDAFKDTPMNIAKGFNLFFYRLNNELCKNILSSMPTMLENQGLNLAEALPSDGDGINLLSDSLESIDAEFQKLEKNLFLNHSHYYHS